MQILILYIWDGVQDSKFLTGPQGRPILLVYGPQFELQGLWVQ